MVVNSSGFEWRPERPEEPTFVEQKWGWTGRKPGGQLVAGLLLWSALSGHTAAEAHCGTRSMPLLTTPAPGSVRRRLGGAAV